MQELLYSCIKYKIITQSRALLFLILHYVYDIYFQLYLYIVMYLRYEYSHDVNLQTLQNAYCGYLKRIKLYKWAYSRKTMFSNWCPLTRRQLILLTRQTVDLSDKPVTLYPSSFEILATPSFLPSRRFSFLLKATIILCWCFRITRSE